VRKVKVIVAGLGSFVILLGLISIFVIKYPLSEEEVLSEKEESETKTLPEDGQENVYDFEYQDKELRAAWFVVENPRQLSLIANFGEELDSEDILEKYSCKRLVSAGFYNEAGMPIGLFVTNEVMISQASENSTFNGFFSVTNEGKVNINMVQSNKLVKIGLQSGPILAQNGVYKKLDIKNDKPARRIVVSLNEQGKIIFFTVFDEDSVFQGPYLNDLPQVLEAIDGQLDIKIVDALNLDGGSASVFCTENISLQELTNVGGFICVE
jgi:uncharacterized protein YigE (DUF2233 family)